MLTSRILDHLGRNRTLSEAEIEIIGVTKRFKDVAAVSSVSLSVRQGEFLTLLGPSGCGKTTLLRLIAGFEFPDEGQVMFGGRNVSDTPPYKRDVTTVFQHYALFPHLDVYRNVAFGLQRKRCPKEETYSRVREALSMVKLTGLENRRPAELSGGQQQRVALARALVLRPKVLLLDEPLAALDLKLRKEMQRELKSLQRQVGISFVYVTHDQEEALTMSDRLAVMNAGRIEQIGAPEQVYEHPLTEFVAGFIGASNVLDATLVETQDGSCVVDISGAKIKLNFTPGAGRRLKLVIKPENTRLSKACDGGLIGVLESASYLGNRTEWRVRLQNGQSIVVLETRLAQWAEQQTLIGQPVSVLFDPDAASVISI